MLHVDRKALLAAASTAKTAAASKGGMLNTLEGMRLAAKPGGLTVACSQLDLSIECTIALDTDAAADGSFVAIPNAGRFHGLLNLLDGERVDLSIEGDDLTVSSGSSTYTLKVYRDEGWPRLPEPKNETILLSAADIDVLRRIIPSASTDAARPTLAAVHFAGSKALATDSYRLARAELSVEVVEPVSIPPSILAAVLKDAPSTGVTMRVDRGNVRFEADGTVWTSSTVVCENGQPNAEPLYAVERPHRISLDGDKVVDALKRLRLVDGETHYVKLAVEDGLARITNKTLDIGDGIEAIPCDGDLPFSIGISGVYLEAAIKANNLDDALVIHFADAMKPIAVVGDRMSQLLMPVRLG